MKIIDAHMHFAHFPGFDAVAREAGHENTVEHYLAACRENGVVMSIVMGNASGGAPQYGGIVPEVPDLAGPFDVTHYNQPREIAYCAGIQSEKLTLENCEATARETERFVRTPQCVGIKIYLGYNRVYADDPRHEPLYALAEQYDVPVVFHTGETAGGWGLLKYAHPLTIDPVAERHPKVRFVMAHCGNPWVLDALEVMAKNENVFVDLSGLLEGRLSGETYFRKQKAYFDYLRMWLDYADRYDKVLYGTDWPLINIRSYIDVMKQLIPQEHQAEFFYQNALRVFPKLAALLPKEKKR
jgi:predicted TIM-barrel fold metal-dependent hydrolase